MSKNSLLQDKRAISGMVSYVLLVIIAVGVSVGVFAYLSLYVPKEKPRCLDDVGLIIERAQCIVNTTTRIELTLVNKGLFTVDAAYIRVGMQGRTVRSQINEKAGFFLNEPGTSEKGLKPGRTYTQSYEVSAALISRNGTYLLEVQPAVWKDGQLALCDKSVIVQELHCI